VEGYVVDVMINRRRPNHRPAANKASAHLNVGTGR
jgi:hypothetical protein